MEVREFARDMVTFGLRPMSVLSLTVCIVGLLLSLCYLVCSCYDSDFGESKPGPTVVYGLHKWVMGYYLAFGLVQLIPLVFYSMWVECFDLVRNKKSLSTRSGHCISFHIITNKNGNSALTMKALGITTMSISFFSCVFILVHFLFIMIGTKGRPSDHILGWVCMGFCVCGENSCSMQCSPCKKQQINDSQQSDGITSENMETVGGGLVSDSQDRPGLSDAQIAHTIPEVRVTDLQVNLDEPSVQ